MNADKTYFPRVSPDHLKLFPGNWLEHEKKKLQNSDIYFFQFGPGGQ